LGKGREGKRIKGGKKKVKGRGNINPEKTEAGERKVNLFSHRHDVKNTAGENPPNYTLDPRAKGGEIDGLRKNKR